jgi:hypothetical protein
VSNRIMPTASFVTPSPKITQNKFGYSSYFTTATAATTSDEHKREHNSSISYNSS